MGLTGLQIFKLLPKTNCGECGPPTCLAFAMELAQQKTSLDKCPYVSEEAKAELGEASAPPIRLITVGKGEKEFQVGDETELFRHDKTFFNETAIGFELEDNLEEKAIRDKAKTIDGLSFERIGLELSVNLVAVCNTSQDAETFAKAVSLVMEETDLPLMLVTEDPTCAAAALEKCASSRPLLYAANNENYEEMTKIADENSCPLVVRGENLEQTAEITDKIAKLGYRELMIDPGSGGAGEYLEDLTQIRRLALRKKFRPLGYPTVVFTGSEDTYQEVIEAAVYTCKYGNVVIMKEPDDWKTFPLLILRQNIYTDPQKPIQVEAGVYEIGEVDENSPVYVTTNFSLTYFSVMGEIEASRVPGYLLIVDTEGTSVLTAWAAGKFDGDKVAEELVQSGLEDRVNHKKVIIPGQVAVLRAKIEDNCDWEVLIGPGEATGIPSFIRKNWQA